MQRSSHSRKPRDVETTYLTGKFTLFYHRISLAGFHPHCNFLTAIELWRHSYHRAHWWLCCPQRGGACLMAASLLPWHCLPSVSSWERWHEEGDNVPRTQHSSRSVGRCSGIQMVFHHLLFNALEEAWCVFKWWQVPKCHTSFFPLWFCSGLETSAAL